MFPNIGDYYRHAIDKTKEEVANTDDARVLGLDAEEWIAYLVKKYGMDAIEFDREREVQAVEIAAKPGWPAFRVDVPVRPSDTLVVIFQNSLVGQSYYMLDYKETFRYDHTRGTISTQTEQTAVGINEGQRKIEEYIRQLNEAIDQENQSFPQRVRQFVTGKQQAVKDKHQRLDDLAKVVGVKIVKQSDVSRVIPTAVTVKREVAALVPPVPRKQPERIVLDRERFDAIMDVID